MERESTVSSTRTSGGLTFEFCSGCQEVVPVRQRTDWQIIEWYRQGYSQREIARHDGRCQATIRKILLKHKVPLRDWRTELSKGGRIGGQIAAVITVESGRLEQMSKNGGESNRLS